MDLHQHHVFVVDQSFARQDAGILIKFWKNYSLIYHMFKPQAQGLEGTSCMAQLNTKQSCLQEESGSWQSLCHLSGSRGSRGGETRLGNITNGFIACAETETAAPGSSLLFAEDDH